MNKRRRPTRFVVPKDMIFFTSISGLEIDNAYFKIEPNGRAVVKKGFRSDGCSPTFKLPFSNFFQFGWVVGPPNGPRDPDTGLPVSARAFFIHDALLDYCRPHVPTKVIHAEFCREINATNWRWKKLACNAVCKFGPRD
jgi:hypothetical protein